MIITQQDRDNFRNSLSDEERNDFDNIQMYLEEFKMKLQSNPEEPETELNEQGNEWDEKFLKWMGDK